MNCKYCGAALPSSGGTCRECGRMIPMDQIKLRKEMLDPKWNDYRNQNTAMYKSNTAYESKNGKKTGIIIVVVIIIIIILLAIRGLS